jgi:hypothetical protein
MQKFLLVILASLSFSSFAVNNYDSGTGVVVMPDVSVDGKVFYDSVTVQFDFSNGTFKLLSAVPKNTAISTTPLQSTTFDSFIVDFLGCSRTGTNEITCYTNITNTGKDTSLSVGNVTDHGGSYLYDDLSKQYGLTSVTVQNQTAGANTITYIQGIPVLAAFKFNDFDIHATAIIRFQPFFFPHGNVTFSNITLN